MIGLNGVRSGEVPDATGASASKTSAENRRIDKSAREFESLLLSSWLQVAYESFGTAPGSEDGEELDAGKEQFQSFAMQSLGSAMTASGGIGIAKMVAEHLHKASQPDHTDPGKLPADTPIVAPSHTVPE